MGEQVCLSEKVSRRVFILIEMQVVRRTEIGGLISPQEANGNENW